MCGGYKQGPSLKLGLHACDGHPAYPQKNQKELLTQFDYRRNPLLDYTSSQYETDPENHRHRVGGHACRLG